MDVSLMMDISLMMDVSLMMDISLMMNVSSMSNISLVLMRPLMGSRLVAQGQRTILISRVRHNGLSDQESLEKGRRSVRALPKALLTQSEQFSKHSEVQS